MAIRCPHCKKEYDVTLFEYGKTVKCVCGNVVNLKHVDATLGESYRGFREEIFRELFNDEEKRIEEIKNLADKIAFLIVSTDYPKIDIEIKKENFRERINELFPDKAYLYELIYEPRFRRLEEQFGSSKSLGGLSP
jgi:hypothetical protein